MISIRSYLPEDFALVKEILEEADLFDETWDSEKNLLSIVQQEPESLVVAVDNGKVVGVLYIIFFGANVAWIFRLAINKAYRKQGIATELLNRAEEIVRSRGIAEMGMYVNAQSSELHAFYEKREFRSTKRPYIYMWKDVKRSY